MPASRSSRQRFLDYLAKVRADAAQPLPPRGKHHGDAAPRPQDPRGRSRSTWQLLASFWNLLDDQKPAVIWGLATLTLSTLLGLLPPASTKFVVDYVLGTTPLPQPWSNYLPSDRWQLLLALVGVMTAVSFTKVVLHIWGRWLSTRATKRMQMSIRRRLFSHAVRLPLGKVQDLKSGGMASLLREDAGSIGDLIFGLLYNPWRAVVQLLGSLIILAAVDWRLLLGALWVLPVVWYTHRTWIVSIRPRFRDIRARRQEIDSQTTETFAGIRIVRAFSRQRTETSRVLTNHHLMGRQELHVWWGMRVIEIIWQLVIPLGSGGLLLYGGWQVMQGSLTTGDVMMFVVYLVMLLEPLAILAESAAGLQNSLSGLDRVLDVLAEPEEMPAPADARRVERSAAQGRLTLEDVWFRYAEGSPWVLRGLDLDIPAGQVVALVGASGAGKTTLSNLVARFYDPTRGRFLLDGVDLREIAVESYRTLLGIVEQDVFLFDGTVAENIAYAVPRASREEILAASAAANADEFIQRLPQGYDTIIGERGVKLSGGQRQRLAIARALLADPKILILDEATSNLDTASERLIQASLQQLMRGRTCVVIAHRLSTIKSADLIVVLEQGEILETGTHDELLRTDGRYRRMVELQSALDVEETLGETVG